jgi:hypothetical protein
MASHTLSIYLPVSANAPQNIATILVTDTGKLLKIKIPEMNQTSSTIENAKLGMKTRSEERAFLSITNTTMVHG